jgi:hypothetical protein
MSVMMQIEVTEEADPYRDPLDNITNISNTESRDGSVHEKVGEKRRCLEEDVWVACDSCDKWRKVPDGFGFDHDKSFFWYMLTDTICATPEEEWGDEEEFVDDAAGEGRRGEGVGSGGGGGGAVKKGRGKCPQPCQKVLQTMRRLSVL